MDDQALWELVRSTWQKINQLYQPAVDPYLQDRSLDWRIVGLLLAALTFEPEYTTPGHLTVRGPYTSPEEYLRRLTHAREKGLLSEAGENRFKLTPMGKQIVQEFIQRARLAMDRGNPLSEAETSQLADYLTRLVFAAVETPPPPEKWSIRLSMKLLPAEKNKLSYIEQTFSCLEAYRDDSHLAAWQSSGLSATALEALTLIWREEAKSLDQLYEKLSFRGYARQVYADAIAELRRRKYISGITDALRVTHEGHRYREQVEDATNKYFFAPWICLDGQAKSSLAGILMQLRESLP